MTKTMFKKIVLVLATATCFTSAAQATLLLTVDRTSDQTAVVTGTGTLDTGVPPSNDHILSLDNIYSYPFSYQENDDVFQSSTLVVGSTPINFAYTAGSGLDANGTGNPVVYFGSSDPSTNTAQSFSSNDAINNGVLNLSLPTGYSFADVGSTGTVYWGVFGEAYVVGTYEIVASSAVPEPTSVALLGLGLLGVAASRRKSAKSKNA